MQWGDIVQFRPPYYIKQADGVLGRDGSYEGWEIGLVLEYVEWEGMVTLLYNNRVLRIQARNAHVYERGFRKQL